MLLIQPWIPQMQQTTLVTVTLSTSLQAFVIGHTATDGTVRGSFSIEGADAAQFSVSAAGEVTAS